MKAERYQQVERLFHSALECKPEDRAAFIEQACAGDEALRHEVESLLPYDDQARSFIETPPSNVAAAILAAEPEQSMAGRALGHYRILSFLGAGGMGEVYLAQDSKLDRKVAIKLLPPESASDQRAKKRLVREAKAAATLNHANICATYEVGEEEGHTFIAMQYVEGETLSTLIQNKSLDPRDAIEIAIQIAGALAEAHSKSVMHRDIKPQNIMITARNQVKVLDFGLAKVIPGELLERPAQTESLLSAPGILIGTVPYMAPEQLSGESVDGRSDLFSLGVVLYEMIAGHAPFRGATAGEIIAAILRDDPPPFGDLLGSAAGRLEQIVRRTLHKHPAGRYQTAGELQTDLAEISRQLDLTGVNDRLHNRADQSKRGTLAVKPFQKLSNYVAITNPRRRGTVIALVLLILIGGVVGRIYFGRSRSSTDRSLVKDTIVLADFENKTGNQSWDATLRNTMAAELQKTTSLSLLSEEEKVFALNLMLRQPNERITPETAREICLRLSRKAFVTGEIAPFGGHYAISVAATDSQTGLKLDMQQEDADTPEQVVTKLAAATARLRANLCRALPSIRLEKFREVTTTTKLEAVDEYSAGVERTSTRGAMEAIPFYLRALSIDPDFADAYAALAVSYWSTGRPGLASENAGKAYALRSRLTDYWRLRIESFNHFLASGDLNARLESLAIQDQVFPGKHAVATDLAVTYYLIGQTDRAISEASRTPPDWAPNVRVLALAQLRLNRFRDARETVTKAFDEGIYHTEFCHVLYELAFIEDNHDAMQDQIKGLGGKSDAFVGLNWQAAAEAFHGRGNTAYTLSQRAIAATARGDTSEIAAGYATEQALRDAVFGDFRRARVNVSQGLKLVRGRASLPQAALALALCGDRIQAQTLADEALRRYPKDTIIGSIWLPSIRAALELRRGRAAQAMDELRAVSPYETAAEFWPQYLRGLANLSLKRGTEASAAFQAIVDNRGQAPLSVLYPLAKLGLARAAVLLSDKTKSRTAYGEFLAWWKDADRELPILIAARRQFGKW